MINKYEIGDKVRVVGNTDPEGHIVGSVGTVVSVDTDRLPYRVVFSVRDSNDFGHGWFAEHELEYATVPSSYPVADLQASVGALTGAQIRAWKAELEDNNIDGKIAPKMSAALELLAEIVVWRKARDTRAKIVIGSKVKLVKSDGDTRHAVGEIGVVDTVEASQHLPFEIRFETRCATYGSRNEWVRADAVELIPDAPVVAPKLKHPTVSADMVGRWVVVRGEEQARGLNRCWQGLVCEISGVDSGQGDSYPILVTDGVSKAWYAPEDLELCEGLGPNT